MITDKQFAQALHRCLPVIPQNIAISLSGGVDSMCLAYMLHQYKLRYKSDLNIYGITIDHQYRQESTDEAHQITSIMNRWNIHHIIKPLTFATDLQSIINESKFEMIARQHRYQRLKETCREIDVSSVLLGHHLDDQIETFILRMFGNSSLFGLRGILSKSHIPIAPEGPEDVFPPIYCYRPFLGFSKTDIIDTATRNGVEWFEDYTNQDPTLTKRNLIRSYLAENPESATSLRKDNILQTMDEVNTLALYIERQSIRLKEKLLSKQLISSHPEIGSMKFQIPYDELEENSMLVISRLFFHSLFPISAAKDYHFKYVKLQDMIHRIVSIHKKSSSSDKFSATCLKLQWDVIFGEKMVEISLRRQNLEEKVEIESPKLESLAINTITWSDWVQFDNRYWFRYKTTDENITSIDIDLYTTSRNKELSKKGHFGSDLPKFSKIMNSPIIKHRLSSTDKEFISFPTLGLMSPGLQVEWSLKDNMFDYVSI